MSRQYKIDNYLNPGYPIIAYIYGLKKIKNYN